MKITMKKSFAVIMALVMCISMLFGLSFTTHAAAYIYNWGARGTVATELSDYAEAFYAENDVALSELLALSGSSSESGVPSSALYSTLHDLMERNHTNPTSYDDTRDLFKYTDCQNGGGSISSFYSGSAIGPSWDDGSTWNREHTWPNSKGDKAGNGENDIMMLRPAAVSENSSRGNKAYGTTTTSSSYYNPNDEGDGAYDLRGDVARIILYQYVRWECTNTGSSYNPTGIFGTDGVIESKELLLDWVEADPVDTWELGRNDAVEAITGTRNVFVDYPELAFDLFNESVPTGYTSPSGGADVDGSTGSGSSNDTTTGTGGNYYVKVTETPADWSGDYLIVYEDGNVAFNGGLATLDAVGNTITVTITDSKIEANDTTNAAKFTIEAVSGGYSIKSASGVYMGMSSNSNEITESSSSADVNTLIINDDSTVNVIGSGGAYLRYNSASNQVRFRYYKSGSYTNQKAIALYKLDTVDDGTGDDNTGDDETGGNTGSGSTVEVEATIDFTSTTQRVSQDINSQVWTNDGLTLTNNKASSSTNVANFSNPVRLYAKSSVEIKYDGGKIKKIVIDGTSSDVSSAQIEAWQTSIENLSDSNISVSLNGKVVTVEFATEVDSFVITSLSAQARAMYITATVLKTSTGGDTTSPVITAQPNDDSYGKVEVSGNYIIATPNEGYEVAGYEIVSGNTNATVTPSGNNFTVETTADVTIQINFVARTQYTVTFKEMGSTTSTQNAYSGDSITLPTITSDDYTVVGWVAAEIDGETTDKPTVYNAGSSYEVTENITFYALYSRTEAGGSGESNVFTKYTGAITEGDYLIVYSGGAMKAAVSSSRLSYSDVTDSSGSITSPDASLIWTVTADGDYWTLYNESKGNYAAGNGTKNQGKLSTSVDDFARWTVSGTSAYEFVNKGNSAKPVNANLRRNDTYGFACYSTSTGGALTLYKRTAAAMTTYYFTSAGETPDYTVTANANNAEYGEVKVSGTTIVATPNEGYTVSGYDITSGTATVIQENNNFYVTPSSNVTVTINFEALPTYTVTFVENGVEIDSVSTYSGGFITLPEYSGELDEYTTFDGWAENKDETDATKIYAAKATFVVTKNVTLYAQFTVTEPEVPEESDHYFVKVTEDQTDWTGTYLIVYEDGKLALNGSLTSLDVASNGKAVEITDGKIAATDSNLAITFTITKNDNGTYTIRSNSGLNIGGKESDDNGMLTNATKIYNNNISIDADGNAVIVCTYNEFNNYMRYNATSGQDRFRYFKAGTYSNQKPIALYKLDVADITGAQVTIGSDLTMKYYVDVTNIANISAGDLTMRFSIDGEVIDTVTGTVVGSQYVFDFAGLAPQRMADIIKAEVLYKNTLVDVKDNYSIKANAQNLLEQYADNESTVQFITDMLYYGAAAQKYTKYNTDNLATKGVIGLGEPLDEELTEDYNKFNLTATTGDAGFKSATVWFDVTNSLIVKVSKKTEDTAVKVYVTPQFGEKTELSYNSDVGGYMTDEIKVTGFNTTYTFELCDENDNVIQTLTYSVNSYAYSKQSSTNANMAELALALFRLGQSAENL